MKVYGLLYHYIVIYVPGVSCNSTGGPASSKARSPLGNSCTWTRTSQQGKSSHFQVTIGDYSCHWLMLMVLMLFIPLMLMVLMLMLMLMLMFLISKVRQKNQIHVDGIHHCDTVDEL